MHELATRQPRGSVVVYASDHEGAADFDATQPFPVIRHRHRAAGADSSSRGAGSSPPSGSSGAHRSGSVRRPRSGCSRPALRAAGARRIVATTHGHEVGWAMLPGARQMLRRIGAGCDVVTYLGEYSRRRLVPVRSAATRDSRSSPPGSTSTRSVRTSTALAIRRRYGLGERPVVVCVSRLVARKGQDTLIRALPALRGAVPDTALLLVGDGRYRGELAAAGAVDRCQPRTSCSPAPVPHDELAAHYAAGDVFAMPCRTRRRGLDVEGLGIVYPRGVGDRSAGRGGRFRRGAGRGPRRRDRLRRRRSRPRRGRRTPRHSCFLIQKLRASMGAAGRAWVDPGVDIGTQLADRAPAVAHRLTRCSGDQSLRAPA